MAYTAWEKTRQRNMAEWGIDLPQRPASFTEGDKYGTNLEKECLAFIREDCEGLRFREDLADCTDNEGDSIGKNQIPYNMEKDTDRLCFERAIHKFMRTGVAEDAFDIYFCYIELFIGKYGKSKELVEMLAEFEQNASSLLMKHRDHYSHSVYVFILGLAIFHNNAKLREQYQMKHMRTADATPNQVACHFLQYWGIASLFHDIGYPFELPFEQVKSYFGDTIKDVPFVSFKGMNDYGRFSEEECKYFSDLYQVKDKEQDDIESVTDLIAYVIADFLSEKYQCSREQLKTQVLDKKPSDPEAFNGFMDHAVFSGIVLYKQLKKVLGLEAIDRCHLDAISAITLHNSMFKFSVRNDMPLPMQEHPLAYLLMLCDELQCWDRTSYGRSSRAQLHPMWFDLTFQGNTMQAHYYYDARMEERKTKCKGTYTKMASAEGEYTADCKFVKDIEEIIEMNIPEADGMKLELLASFEKVDNLRKLNTYLSSSNFIHLYNFAVLVHGRSKKKKNPDITFEELEDYFNESTLEYQLSVIERTKNYAMYLDKVGMFYTDKSVVYEMVTAEDVKDEIEYSMGELEHIRWKEDKLSLGWKYSRDYVTGKDQDGKDIDDKVKRERARIHKDIMTYQDLDEETQNKDKEPLREMLPLLETMDGIRVYHIPGYQK